MHQSEYSGDMWWCCGKLAKDALGCKFGKHEIKVDEDDADVYMGLTKKPESSSLAVCQCCKQVGHQMHNC